jgi:DNA mismatch endonuclease (patch repair protein)
MSKIRSKGTKPERMFRRFLDEIGVKYEYQPDLYGRPDFLLNDKVVVFIDCKFWHGRGNMPKQNQEYWLTKLERNRRRDVEVTERLTSQGFKVVRLDDKEVLKSLRIFRDD